MPNADREKRTTDNSEKTTTKKRNREEEKEVIGEVKAKTFSCGEKGCDYKANLAGTLKNHKANIHDIATFYLCGVGGCDFKASLLRNLKIHKAHIHDVDVTLYFLRSRWV